MFKFPFPFISVQCFGRKEDRKLEPSRRSLHVAYSHTALGDDAGQPELLDEGYTRLQVLEL
jgi:hypothetical protein